MKINWVDILIVIYVVRAFFVGRKRGFSVEIIALIAALMAWIIALHFYQSTGSFLSSTILLSLATARALAFMVIAVGSFFIFALIGKLLTRVMTLNFLPNIETVGGCVLGTLRGIIIAAIIVSALALMPAGFVQQEVYTNSFLGNYMVALGPTIHKCFWPGRTVNNNRFSSKVYWAQLPQKPKGNIL